MRAPIAPGPTSNVVRVLDRDKNSVTVPSRNEWVTPISLANTDDKTAVWNVFHQIPAVSSGMAKILQREVEAAPENSELTQN